MLDNVKGLGEVGNSKKRVRSWLGIVKLIQNRLKKLQNLIVGEPSKAEIGMVGRENEVRFYKEESTR